MMGEKTTGAKGESTRGPILGQGWGQDRLEKKTLELRCGWLCKD